MDALVHATRRLHGDDAGSPTRRRRVQSGHVTHDDGIHDDHPQGSSVSLFKTQEEHELHLISTALHSKDIVGLFSLLTVFWSTRNRLVRELETLQFRLGGSSGAADGGDGSGIDSRKEDDGDDDEEGRQTRPTRIHSFNDAVKAAQDRLDSMQQSIAASGAATWLSAGAADALLKEREAALVWHQKILAEGSYVDVIKLSVDLQQEYQKSQAALYDPFRMLLPPPGSGSGGDARAAATRTTTDFDYLDSLHAMVTSSLESQAAVKDELVAMVAEYDAAAHTFAAPPVMRLLGVGSTSISNHHHTDSRTPRSSTTVFATNGEAASHHDNQGAASVDVDAALRLVPDYIDDVVDPLTTRGGASIMLPHRGDSSSVSGLWRLIKFVGVDCAAGETFLSVLQRASLLVMSGGSDNDGVAGGGAPEQWNARNVFCPINKKPVVECVGMWLPPDPRLAVGSSGDGNRSRTAGVRTAQMTPPATLLNAVLKDAMPLVVRVVVPLGSLAPAIRALLSQRHALEHDTIPKLRKEIADAKQLLWSAEIEAIEQRTSSSSSTRQHPHQHGSHNVATIKGRLQSLESQDAVCVQALSQCQEHLRALEHGDLAALSAMLTASTSRIESGDATLSSSSCGLAERIVHVCKELPRGSSLDEFAASFGVAVDDLHVFEDLVVAPSTGGNGSSSSISGGGGAATAALSAWASAAGEDARQPTSASQRRTLVYIPVRVPVTSVVEQDRLLTEELDAYAREYPSFPPNAEVLDHLAALRRGDINTMSALLSSTRAKRKAFDDTSRAGALQRRVDDLQHEVSRLLHDADEMKEALRSSDVLVREKTTALERLSWHQHHLQKSTANKQIGASPQLNVPLDEGLEGAKEQFLLSEWTPDACMQRGLSPAEALEYLTNIVSRQEGTITSLRLMIKRCEEEKDNTTKDTILRLGSSTARLKQVKDLEATVDGLKNELKEEVRRGAEATARVVQLEQLNTRLTKDMTNQQRALQSSKETHTTDLEELKELRRDLREAQSRANTAERDAQKALEVQLLSSTRHTFAAKEIPKGMTAAEFLRHLGVHGPVAEISLAKGAVFDELRQAHYVYVPVQVERGPWSAEDERLQSDMARASVDLQRVGAPQGGGATHHTDILDQLSALRIGDTVALSSMLRQYRSKIAALEEFAADANSRLGASGVGGDGLAGSISPQSVADSLREEDDLAWSTIKEGRAKVTLLRAALRHADAERVQWKTLCEEYQAAEGEVQRRLVSLEDTNRAATTRLDAVQSLLQAREKDVVRLKRQLQEAEEEMQSSDARHLEQRRATDESHRSEMDTLHASLVNETAARVRDVQELQDQLAHERSAVSALRDALAEMGVEMVID
jgi:hypothetical protein